MLPGRVDRHWGGRKETFPDGTPAGLYGGKKPTNVGGKAAATSDDQAAAQRQPAQADTPPGSPRGAAAQPSGTQAAAGGAANVPPAGGAAPRPVPAGAATGAVPRQASGVQQRGEPMLVDPPPVNNRLPAFEQLTRRGEREQIPEFRPRQHQQQPAQNPNPVAPVGEPYPMLLPGHIEPPPNAYYQIPTHPPPAQPYGNVIVAYPPPGFVVADQVQPYVNQPQFITPVYPMQAQPYNYYPPNLPPQQFVTPPHAIFQQPQPQFPVPSAPPLSAIYNQPLPQPAPVQISQPRPQPPPRFPINEYPPLEQAARPRPPTNAPNPSQNTRRSVPMDGVEPTVQRQAAQSAQRPLTQASSNPQPSTSTNPRPSTSSSSSSSNVRPDTHDAYLHSQHVNKLNGGYVLRSQLYHFKAKTTQPTHTQPRTNPHVRPSTSQHAPQPMDTNPPASSNPKHSTPKGKSSGKQSSKSSKRKADSRMTPSPPQKRPKDGSSDQPFQLSSSDDDFAQR